MLSDGGDSYGSLAEEGSDQEEDEEGMDLPQEEERGGKKAGKKRGRDEFEGMDIKKTQSGMRYASYEDFAHLLEEGLDEEVIKPKKSQKITTHNFAD